MSGQVYSVPGQTQGKRKVFLEWTSIDLFSKQCPTRGGNLTNIKRFIILGMSTLPVEIRNTQVIFKKNQ